MKVKSGIALRPLLGCRAARAMGDLNQKAMPATAAASDERKTLRLYIAMVLWRGVARSIRERHAAHGAATWEGCATFHCPPQGLPELVHCARSRSTNGSKSKCRRGSIWLPFRPSIDGYPRRLGLPAIQIN
jgi:hypothetical protein